MVKKNPILASSPDIIPNEVEVQGDVNILEMAPGHLSQDEENGEVAVQKKLEVEVQKL